MPIYTSLLKPKTTEPDFVIPKDGDPYIYTVRSGDVLGLIADRNNVRVSQLQDWNGLNGTMINVGQKLTIYGKSSKSKVEKLKVPKQKVEKKAIQKAPVREEKDSKPSNSQKENTQPSTQNSKLKTLTVYTVKSGDNLWAIAKKYSGVSAKNIMDFNGINGELTVGQKINIPKYD